MNYNGSVSMEKQAHGPAAWLRRYLADTWKAYVVSFLLMGLAITGNAVTGPYVTRVGNAAPGDIILDRIGPIDLSFVFVYGFIFMIVGLFLYALIRQPRSVPSLMNHVAVTLLTRASFIVMTHLKNPPTAVPVQFPFVFDKIAFENDLFFSGHTAIPFMGFLFLKTKARYVFLAASIMLGGTAMLMHRHYSIDVFAAFYITYGTYILYGKLSGFLGSLIGRRAR